jgi:signal transduction histidine kinase
MGEHGGNEFSLDTWIALLAGPNPWINGDEPIESWTRLLCFVETFAMAVTASTLLTADGNGTTDHRIATYTGTLAIALLAIQPITRLLGRPPRVRSMHTNLVARAVLFATLCFSISVVLPGWNALWSSSFAVAVGIDASLSCKELGWEANPRRWYLNFLRSGFHLGIIGALAATIVLGSRESVVLPVFACIHLWAATSMITLWVVSNFHRGQLHERADAIAEVVEAERRQRAHWLHDDVCAQLRLVSLKVQTNTTTHDEIVELLDDFDHQLRLRQLDELLGAGRVRVAELLQPYIRNAQNHGVTINGVPSFEEAALALPEASARLAARAANVLTANAINAGATTISFEVSRDDRFLSLTVMDDGPGFNLSEIPHGRGLWTLAEDLKPGGIEVSPGAERGVSVTATIPISERRTRVNDLARR